MHSLRTGRVDIPNTRVSQNMRHFVHTILRHRRKSYQQQQKNKPKTIGEILQNLPICLVAVSHRWHPQHL